MPEIETRPADADELDLWWAEHNRQMLRRARDVWRRAAEVATLDIPDARAIADELRAGALDICANALEALDALEAGEAPPPYGPRPDDLESFRRAERYLEEHASGAPDPEAVAAFLKLVDGADKSLD
jgi:hypothetical protein